MISQGATKPRFSSYLFLVFDNGTIINTISSAFNSDDGRVRDGDIKVPPQDAVDRSNWMCDVIFLPFTRSTGNLNEDTLVV